MPQVLRDGTADENDQAVAICLGMWRDAQKASPMKQTTLGIPLEIKALNEGEFEGHGSVFRNIDLGGDIVVPGAFKRSLAEHRRNDTTPQMFWMHNPGQVPGKWLAMSEDSDGLSVKGTLADTQLGNEMRTLMKMKAVRGLSIGYVARDVDFDADGNRLLKDIDLWEVSLVSLAMNPLAQITSAKARLSGDGEYVPTEREFELQFRRMGCSRSVACKLASRLFDDVGARGSLGGHQRESGVVVSEEEREAQAVIEALQGQMLQAALDDAFKAFRA